MFLLIQKKCLSKSKLTAFLRNQYHSVSSALLLEENVVDSDTLSTRTHISRNAYNFPTTCYASMLEKYLQDDETPDIHNHVSSKCLFPMVVRVIKCLNWQVTRKLRFREAVKEHGFRHSVNTFRIIIHVFALAGMEREAYSLVLDIFWFFKKRNLNMGELFPTLLDSSGHVERSVVVFDVLMKVFAANKMRENAIDVFWKIKKCGLVPNIGSCNFLLKCLAEASESDDATILFENLKTNGPSPNVYTHTIMMNFLPKGMFGQDVDIYTQATQIIENICTGTESASAVTYSTYLCVLCKIGRVDVALLYLRNLSSTDQPLNSYCYNTVMYWLGRKGKILVLPDELDEAVKVFKEMKDRQVLPDAHSFSILIDVLCEKGEYGECLKLIKDMDRSNVKPLPVPYCSLYRLYKAGVINVSLDLFSGDKGAYTSLIKGLCMLGDMDSAIKFLKQMISSSFFPDSYTFSCLIKGFCKAGRLEKAVKFFNSMVQIGVFPGVFACNVIIEKFCEEGNFEAAFKCIYDMQEIGISPNSYTFNAIIKGLCTEQRSEKAMELLALMLKKNVVDLVCFSTLIDGFAKQAKTYEAFKLYIGMKKLGVSPDKVAYTILINIFSQREAPNDDMSKSQRLFDEMVERGLCPDAKTYTSMIAGYGRFKDEKAMMILFEEMCRKEVKPTVVTFTSLIAGFDKLKRMDFADMMLAFMEKFDIRLDAMTCKSLILGYQRHGQFDRRDALIHDIKENRILLDDKYFTNLRLDHQITKKNM